MSPLKHSKSFAARMGRWSADHWKTAVVGWLAFVVLSVFVGAQIGTTQIDKNDATVGESHKADRIIADAGFSLDADGNTTAEQGEMVLVQAKQLPPQDAAFRAVVADAITSLNKHPQVTNLRSPLTPSHADLISKDG